MSNPIPINLQPGSQVSNHLYDSMEPAYLLEDLVAVELANGIVIEAGWYPERDPSGHYMIRAYSTDWQEQIGRRTAKSPQEVAATIESLAELLTRPDAPARIGTGEA